MTLKKSSFIMVLVLVLLYLNIQPTATFQCKKRNNEWMRNGSKARCIFNVYMYRRSEHQSSNLKSNSYQLVTWRGQQAKDLVKKFKLFAIKALKIDYQVTKSWKCFWFLNQPRNRDTNLTKVSGPTYYQRGEFTIYNIFLTLTG